MENVTNNSMQQPNKNIKIEPNSSMPKNVRAPIAPSSIPSSVPIKKETTMPNKIPARAANLNHQQLPNAAAAAEKVENNFEITEDMFENFDYGIDETFFEEEALFAMDSGGCHSVANIIYLCLSIEEGRNSSVDNVEDYGYFDDIDVEALEYLEANEYDKTNSFNLSPQTQPNDVSPTSNSRTVYRT